MSTPAPRRGLGRGLEVLFGAVGEPELAHLPVESIEPNPRQPRRSFDAEAIESLAESIRSQGVVQPVVVRPTPAGGYELIAGERRWRAARLAGVPTVPALVRQADDRETLLLGLAENVAREQLSPLEEARAYAVLVDELGFSLGEIAERVGRSKPGVSNRLRLLELPDEVLELLDRRELSEGHARAVLAAPGHEEQRRLARLVVRRGLSVRETESAAQSAGAKRRPSGATRRVDPALAERVRAAAERLTGCSVRVLPGRLEVSFADEYELLDLAEALDRAGSGTAADAPLDSERRAISSVG